MVEIRYLNQPTANEATRKLTELRRFEGAPEQFWRELMTATNEVLGASGSLLLARQNENWRRLLSVPESGGRLLTGEIEQRILALAEEVPAGGLRLEKVQNRPLAVGAFAIKGERSSLVAFDGLDSADELHLLQKFELISDIPGEYQLLRETHHGLNNTAALDLLDLNIVVNESSSFLQAVMTLCNELASRYECDRVSLGWLEGAYIELQAISHMESFNRKMDVVGQLERLMEEAFDQDKEVVFPDPETGFVITRDHGSFAKQQEVEFLLSIPVRVNHAPVGVLTLERSQQSFTAQEVTTLRAQCDQVARLLMDLRKQSGWFGRRLARRVKETASPYLGAEYTWSKIFAIAGFLLLFFLTFFKVDYRIEAAFILRSDDVAYVPAPFDGYIDEVHVEIGDTVANNEVMLVLDTDDLLLQEAEAFADQSRYAREEEKARALYQTAEMRIAEAMKDQASARLKQIRYDIGHASLTSPFNGMVVEGELKRMQGAPVKKGDVLFKVSRLSDLYVELDIDERDIHDVAIEQGGEISFLSRPDLAFPIEVIRVYPSAQIKGEKNVFLAEATPVGDTALWWRPGMSGIAKVTVGERSILWIVFHRTVSYLRLALWW